jgi:hypothetical protein
MNPLVSLVSCQKRLHIGEKLLVWLEELFFQLCGCVSFGFWREIGFGFTYLGCDFFTPIRFTEDSVYLCTIFFVSHWLFVIRFCQKVWFCCSNTQINLQNDHFCICRLYLQIQKMQMQVSISVSQIICLRMQMLKNMPTYRLCSPIFWLRREIVFGCTVSKKKIGFFNRGRIC